MPWPFALALAVETKSEEGEEIAILLGAMVLNEMRASFVVAKKQDLVGQAQVFSNLLAEGATFGQPQPVLDENLARATLAEARDVLKQSPPRPGLLGSGGLQGVSAFALSVKKAERRPSWPSYG